MKPLPRDTSLYDSPFWVITSVEALGPRDEGISKQYLLWTSEIELADCPDSPQPSQVKVV